MLIFAHRGASADAPENTLLAFEQAIEQGADGIELDVYQQADEFIVIHDKWLMRTTNGKGQISDFSVSELQQFDAGMHQQIPTLREALARINGRCHVNIEVKGITEPEQLLTQLTQAQSFAHFTAEQFLISSFDHHVLSQLRQQEPSLKYGALTASKPIHYAQFAQDLNAYSIHIDATFLDKAFVDDAKQRGLQVFAFTLDHSVDIQRLFHWGVDAIFTNRPAYARNIIADLI